NSGWKWHEYSRNKQHRRIWLYSIALVPKLVTKFWVRRESYPDRRRCLLNDNQIAAIVYLLCGIEQLMAAIVTLSH
ncbi:hypothetical protein, partial [Chamaesiphon sp. VAR_48_metabat_403]|uniref:hypothetical protein n=1 Tax=Chamaesiphon sp. VAR_48_metabat_403 TaxID=2964700 RepID=UPI00286D71DB